MTDLDDDFRLLTDAVREAGELALTYQRKSIQIWQKADGSEVSEADFASNALLERRLGSERPDYGWLSEEKSDVETRLAARLKAKRVWIVDPIDGTRAFLGGTPDWTISVALVEDGQPVMGAVYNPTHGEFFSARVQKGAWLNGATLRVRDPGRIEGCRVIAPENMLRPKYWEVPLPPLALTKINSIAYRLSLVAAERASATFAFTPKSEWDLAAGVLIAAEAGCTVTAGDGTPFVFNNPDPRVDGFLAAAPILHNLLLARKKTAAPMARFPAGHEPGSNSSHR